jgi:hypothetical protein
LRRILAVLSKELAFLYEERGYRFLELEVIKYRPDCGIVLLTNGRVVVELDSERDNVFFSMRHSSGKPQHDTISLDILRQILTGEINDSGLVNEQSATFLQKEWKSLERLFLKKNLAETNVLAAKLEKARSKRMWG